MFLAMLVSAERLKQLIMAEETTDSDPREERGGGFLVSPANLLEEADRMENFGETLGMLQHLCDVFFQRVGQGGG